MAAVLKTYLSLSLEMRDVLRLLVNADGPEPGYRSWAGCSINGTPVRRPTVQALIRRGLVEEWPARSGTYRFYPTKLGRTVAEG